MKNFSTWGDLRTLNTDTLLNKMVALGKGKRIHFRMSVSLTAQEYVIIPKEDYDEILSNEVKINNLKMRLKTIVNVAEL